MKDALTSSLAAARAVQADLDALVRPPEAGGRPKKEFVVAFSIVRGTRAYIEKVVDQINGSYEGGYFDACLVMCRRLIETLIIECFEQHKISSTIKNTSGDYLYLSDLIPLTLRETTWTLGRNARTVLPRLKDLGDKSAHGRRFNAHRSDIDKVIDDIRVVVQELIHIADLAPKRGS